MPENRKLTKQELEEGSKHLYHHVVCRQFKELKITLTEKGLEHKMHFAILGLSSKETIRTGLKAVDLSPFKTVFVIEGKSGKILFALSKNEEYVEAAKKKRPPPPPPPPPPLSYCCQICSFQGGTSCQELSDGSCICFGTTRGDGSVDLDDELATLAF